MSSQPDKGILLKQLPTERNEGILVTEGYATKGDDTEVPIIICNVIIKGL